MLLLAATLLLAGIGLYIFVPALQIYATYPWPVYLLLLGSVASAVASRSRAWLKYPVLGISSGLSLLFIFYTLWLSALPHGEVAVRPGDRFPDFTLQTSKGQSFSPSTLVGKSAALYVFYRGDW